MCIFQDERTILVCDVAIGRVMEDLQKAFGGRVKCTPVDGRQFTRVACAAIEVVQEG